MADVNSEKRIPTDRYNFIPGGHRRGSKISSPAGISPLDKNCSWLESRLQPVLIGGPPKGGTPTPEVDWTGFRGGTAVGQPRVIGRVRPPHDGEVSALDWTQGKRDFERLCAETVQAPGGGTQSRRKGSNIHRNTGESRIRDRVSTRQRPLRARDAAMAPINTAATPGRFPATSDRCRRRGF
jgi:hypothetical protein